MPRSQSSSEAVANWPLAALPGREYQKLLPNLEPVPLNFQDVLHEAGRPIRHVYFPLAGLVSLLGYEEGGKVVEVAAIGKEGVVGLPVLLGNEVSPHRAMVHCPGQALRMGADLFRAKVQRSQSFTSLLLRYADALFVEISQTAVCNSLHSLQQRYCRWLLLAHDRVGSDELPFTQKFLALILAVRLASISEAASRLQRAGLIRYRRGVFRILDRQGLERGCCGCYRIINHRFESLGRRDEG